MQLVKPNRIFVPVSKPRPGWEIRGRVNGVRKGGGLRRVGDKGEGQG